jgi:hypothetical protein
MNMVEKLASLRAGIPGCHVATFIDLGSKMVMAVDARSKQPQERLDTMADRADRLFASPRVIMTGMSEHPPDKIVTVTQLNVEAFLRVDGTSEDALGLVCDHSVDIEKAVQLGRALLADME